MIACLWPPCDLAIAISCPTYPRPNWGYLCAFGGGNNTFYQIIGGGRMKRAMTRYPKKLIEMGKVYHIVATKDGKKITLEVDGKELLSTKDEDPLGGPGFNHVGVLTWNGMWVHEVKVYERATPHPDTPKFVQKVERRNA